MSDNHPADEREDAFFGALLVIMQTALAAGMDRTALAARLQQVADSAKYGEPLNKSGVLEIVVAALDHTRYRASLTVIEESDDAQKSN
jgi:hypothetical protein